MINIYTLVLFRGHSVNILLMNYYVKILNTYILVLFRRRSVREQDALRGVRDDAGPLPGQVWGADGGAFVPPSAVWGGVLERCYPGGTG